MKLSDFKGEEAILLLGDLIDPCMEIFTDEELRKAYEKETVATCVKLVLKSHPRAVLTILALLDGVPVDKYECNPITLPMKVMQIINDEELRAFFLSSAQMASEKPTGSATANTTGDEK